MGKRSSKRQRRDDVISENLNQTEKTEKIEKLEQTSKSALSKESTDETASFPSTIVNSVKSSRKKNKNNKDKSSKSEKTANVDTTGEMATTNNEFTVNNQSKTNKDSSSGKKFKAQEMHTNADLVDTKKKGQLHTPSNTSNNDKANTSKEPYKTPTQLKTELKGNDYFTISKHGDIISKVPYIPSENNPFACYQHVSALECIPKAPDTPANPVTVYFTGFKEGDTLANIFEWIDANVDSENRPYHAFFMPSSQHRRREKPLCLKFHNERQLEAFSKCIVDGIMMERNISKLSQEEFLRKNYRQMKFSEGSSRGGNRGGNRGGSRGGNRGGSGFGRGNDRDAFRVGRGDFRRQESREFFQTVHSGFKRKRDFDNVDRYKQRPAMDQDRGESIRSHGKKRKRSSGHAQHPNKKMKVDM